jgi:hypothetical protein
MKSLLKKLRQLPKFAEYRYKYYLTKEMVASFFEVGERTIERYVSAYSDELTEN